MSSYAPNLYCQQEEFHSEGMSNSQYSSHFSSTPSSQSVLEENPVLKDMLSDPFSDNISSYQDGNISKRSTAHPLSSGSSSTPVWDNFGSKSSGSPSSSWMSEKSESPGYSWVSQKSSSPVNGFVSNNSAYCSSYDNKEMKQTEWLNSYNSSSTNHNLPNPNQNCTPYVTNPNQNGASTSSDNFSNSASPWSSINNNENQVNVFEYGQSSESKMQNWDCGPKPPVQGQTWTSEGRPGSQPSASQWQSGSNQMWGRQDPGGQFWNRAESQGGAGGGWNRMEQGNQNWMNKGPAAYQKWAKNDQRSNTMGSWARGMEQSTTHWGRSEPNSPALPPWEEYNPQTGKRKRVNKNMLMTDFEALAGAMEDSNSNSESLPYSCSVCGKSFKFKAFLKLHFQKHTDEKPYSCEFCGKCYSYKSSLQTHRLLHLEPGASYTCDICGIEFNKKQYLAKHKMKDHAQENSDKQYSCGSCHKRFLSAFDLKHHSNCQVKEKPFQCSICHKFFSAKNSLKVHEKLHMEKMQIDARGFPCEMCGESFQKEEMLNEHRRMHLEGKTYACDICGTTFGYRGQLQRHILMCRKVPEDNTLKYKCNMCGQMFRCDWQLQQHMESHQNSVSAGLAPVLPPSMEMRSQCVGMTSMGDNFGVPGSVSVQPNADPYTSLVTNSNSGNSMAFPTVNDNSVGTIENELDVQALESGMRYGIQNDLEKNYYQ